MGCVTFSVIVAILPAGGALGGVYDVACNICYVCDVAIAQYEWTLNEVDFPLILFVWTTQLKVQVSIFFVILFFAFASNHRYLASAFLCV